MIRFNNILAAVDFSECGKQALRAAVRLAGDAKANLHVSYVQVLHDDPFMPVAAGAHQDRIREALEAKIEGSGAREKVASVHAAVLRDVSAAPALVRYAADNDIDLVVLGTHGRRGLRRLMLGSVAEELVRTSPCPVLTVHSADRTEGLTPGPNAEILVPVDFSSQSLAAIPLARELASMTGARIRMLHVIEEVVHPAFYNAGAFSIYDIQPDVEERALEHLKDAYTRQYGPAVPVVFEVISGHAAAEIVAAARVGNSGMIVMATHGLGGMAHVFLGSVAERVVRMATCPVLTVKTPIAKGAVAQPLIKSAASS